MGIIMALFKIKPRHNRETSNNPCATTAKQPLRHRCETAKQTGETTMTTHTKIIGVFTATVYLEPGEVPQCEISREYDGEVMSASINRIRNIDGCVEGISGMQLAVPAKVADALEEWAVQYGA